ncbi:predicted protein [Histoplasma capsulatum G186AR]|uniref:Uncharacterized protein n=1 Tax=Ajellomyces capsulatus (strain G186AR / H82 / ATCC MYA-2454 / RMSCC 2432) TaxID=447093 RepID=C0NIL6_AJECG|nr:uncharacterized protein HCBG_02273 [Histoplasma capsulatum G186AR]EEH08736.1 predicted protein [Histoplasma capsulatum G186AR]
MVGLRCEDPTFKNVIFQVSLHQATERSIRHKGDTILLRPFRHPADGKWAKSDHIPPERIDSNYLPACAEGEVYLGKFWMGEDSTRGAVQEFVSNRLTYILITCRVDHQRQLWDGGALIKYEGSPLSKIMA